MGIFRGVRVDIDNETNHEKPKTFRSIQILHTHGIRMDGGCTISSTCGLFNRWLTHDRTSTMVVCINDTMLHHQFSIMAVSTTDLMHNPTSAIGRVCQMVGRRAAGFKTCSYIIEWLMCKIRFQPWAYQRQVEARRKVDARSIPTVVVYINGQPGQSAFTNILPT